MGDREEGEGVVVEGVGEEREVCGPSKFSIPRTSRGNWWSFECQSSG